MIDWAIPGQKVVCIGDRWSPVFDDIMEMPSWIPVKGQVLTIRKVVEYPEERLGLLFEEFTNPIRINSEPAFAIEQFRPVRKTNIDVFLKILDLAPHEYDEVEE